MSIKTLPLHQNGHWLLREGETDVTVIEFDNEEPWLSGAPRDCANCGEYNVPRVTGDAVYIDKPCAYPDGVTTVVTLKVPSGKIIVTDDLRPIYDGCDHDGFVSYNTAWGQAQVVEAMAAIGCAYGPVGNSSPGLYQTGPASYVIASPEYNEDDEPSDEPTGDLAGAKDLASICTDLWAYSIADYEDWKAKGGDPEKLGWTDSIVEIPAGTYQFTHHTGENGFDHYAAGTVIFAHIERIA